MADPLVTADDLQAYCTQLLVALGVPEPDADLVAGTLVEADLRGVHSHGANLMSLYVNRIRAGHIKPVTEVTVVADNGSTVMLDGGLGLGQIVGIRAADLSVERARNSGWPWCRSGNSPIWVRWASTPTGPQNRASSAWWSRTARRSCRRTGE